MARQTAHLQSSVIRMAEYDDETEQLEVHFYGGKTYSFYDVPPDIFEELQSAPSPGAYFNANIKGRFA